MKKLEYSVVVEPLFADVGGGFVATVPDPPGCISAGQPSEAALINIQDAINALITAAHDLDRKIATPSRRLTLAS